MTIKELLSQNKSQFTRYILGAVLTIFNNFGLTIALSVIFSTIELTDANLVKQRLILAGVLALLPIGFQIISRLLRIGFMRDILTQVRILAYQKMMHYNYEEYHQIPQETHLSHLVSDINLFEKDFFLAILNMVFAFGSFTLGLMLLAYLNLTIALSTLIMALVLFAISKYFEPKVKAVKRETVLANANYNIELTNMLNGLEVIKLYSVEADFKLPFFKLIKRLEMIKSRAFWIDNLNHEVNFLLATAYQMLIYVYATYLYSLDQLSLTALVIVFNLIGQLVWSLISGFSFINRYKAAVEIYDKIAYFKAPVSASEPFSLNQKLAVDQLNFAYQPTETILNNLSFNLPAKSKLLIIGPAGCGKTTLLNCLAQNLTSYLGAINYDQRELKTINHDDFLADCGYIRQQHFIFSDTIKNNIILNTPYDEKKFKQVLKQEALSDWINSLALKADHLLEQDGKNISGGERQRISIARELYQDKEILFADEPAASLDDYTAEIIYNSLLTLDKTLICVSHRHLEYLKPHFDQIIDLGENYATR